MIEDKLLIWKLKSGDGAALTRVYEKYKNDLLRIATGLSNRTSAAEDIVHDVFVSLAQSPQKLKLSGNLKGYLATCVANRVRNSNRAGQREQAISFEENEPMTADSQPDRWIIRTEELDRLNNAMAQLPYPQREVVELEKSTEGLDKDAVLDTQALSGEFNAARQMSKLCVGRKGNHFPVLLKHYFIANLNLLGIRENVINIMAAVEELDPGLFIRRYREQDNRIVPNVLLLPNYGDFGICWQPFEKHNRSTSRGRLAIPIFPKNLTFAVVSALADLRWQVAKERAQHRWMDEGITGRYYMWFSENKMKGDVKDSFIRDYILWITKESEGVQKLDREIRGVFWRMMPFPNEIKLKLKNRGFVYGELYKKDQNIAMSDGY